MVSAWQREDWAAWDCGRRAQPRPALQPGVEEVGVVGSASLGHELGQGAVRRTASVREAKKLLAVTAVSVCASLAMRWTLGTNTAQRGMSKSIARSDSRCGSRKVVLIGGIESNENDLP